MTIRNKKRLIVAGIVSALLAALVFAIPSLINPNRYRPRIIAYLQQKTGKQVEIRNLSLSLFPVCLHMDDIGVKNPPIFPTGYVVKVARIDAELSFA
ncbi:MAG TPA: AsmA family protein, partial [Chthoniobacterales bacterium]|nr:AsmA family protein [Chthoniobacterales bacterium]